MFWKQLFATKSLEILQAEVKGENRLRRVLGPIALTASGIGAIIGSGIFVMTGRVAAQDAGPAVVLSFVVAGIACLFAALCYAEFASMAPVAGSAYTYAYATLGEVFAWIIGWELVLEYAMACACVASSWSNISTSCCSFSACRCRPFSAPTPSPRRGPGSTCRRCSSPGRDRASWSSASARAPRPTPSWSLSRSGVVLFVIGAGIGYVSSRNWKEVPVDGPLLPEEMLIPSLAKKEVDVRNLNGRRPRNGANKSPSRPWPPTNWSTAARPWRSNCSPRANDPKRIRRRNGPAGRGGICCRSWRKATPTRRW